MGKRETFPLACLESERVSRDAEGGAATRGVERRVACVRAGQFIRSSHDGNRAGHSTEGGRSEGYPHPANVSAAPATSVSTAADEFTLGPTGE